MTSERGCPVHQVPWFDSRFQHDPFTLLGGFRSEGPVFYDETLGYYVVSRYADVVHVLLNRETFAAANASSPLFSPCPEAQRILKEEGYKRVPTLNNADPPRHGPMRQAVRTCMSRRRIQALEPTVRDCARDLIQAIAAKPEADLVADLAQPLPVNAALGLIGVPKEDTGLIVSWGDRRVLFTYGRLSDEEQVEVAHNVGAFWRYCEEFIAERDRRPQDDYTSDLLRYRDEHPDEITTDDIVNIVYSMVLAGHESTTNALSSGLRHLLAARDQWQALVEDPSLIANAAEECLRFDPPVFGHRRITTRETEIDGVRLPEGAPVIMLFGSAHRDDAHFAGADRFDVHREDANTHVAFGKGAHLCLGAPLARMEIKVALEYLVELTPEIHLVEDQPLPYVGNALWRTLAELWAIPHA